DALGDLAADLDIEANEGAGRVVEGEGGVGALGADAERPRLLDLIERGLGERGGCEGELQEASSEQCLGEFHRNILLGWPAGEGGITGAGARKLLPSAPCFNHLEGCFSPRR